jgi:hypothetical protein
MRTIPPMRIRILLAVCAVLLAIPAVAAAITRTGEFTAGFAATTHTPTVNARWPYVVSAKSLSGKALKASVHLQVFQNGKRVDIVGWRQFTGTYKSFKRWPPSTRGQTYVFQALVISTGANGRKATIKLNYAVTPR